MNKKHVRGFTLIECLVALALLGITSLTMAQIYAAVGKMNRTNHTNNTSLAYQMKIVEKAVGADVNSTIEIKYKNTADVKNSTVPHKNGTLSANSVKITSSYSNKDYSYGVNSYVILTRYYDKTSGKDKAVNPSDDSTDNLRYKYFIGTLGG